MPGAVHSQVAEARRVAQLDSVSMEQRGCTRSFSHLWSSGMMAYYQLKVLQQAKLAWLSGTSAGQQRSAEETGDMQLKSWCAGRVEAPTVDLLLSNSCSQRSSGEAAAYCRSASSLGACSGVHARGDNTAQAKLLEVSAVPTQISAKPATCPRRQACNCVRKQWRQAGGSSSRASVPVPGAERGILGRPTAPTRSSGRNAHSV